MAKMFLYNDLLAPVCAHWFHGDDVCDDGDYWSGTGEHIIFKLNGSYYMVHTGYGSGLQFAVDSSVNKLWLNYSGTSYELVNNSWVKLDSTFPTDTYITDAENIVWTNYKVDTVKLGGWNSSGVYMAGNVAQWPVTDITIYSPDSITIGKESKSIDITVDLSYLDTCDTSITYTMTGVTSSGTALIETGITSGSYVKHNKFVLTVDPSEKVQNITLTFTSVARPSITSSKTIRIFPAPNIHYDAKSLILGRMIGKQIAERKNIDLISLNPDIDIILNDSVLHVKNAKVIKNGSILEVK